MNKLVEFTGEIWWAKTVNAELSPFKNKPTDPDKWQWKTAFKPDQTSLMAFMDLQSLGIKNKLGKPEDGVGYIINVNRPTETVNKKTGKVIKKFDPPQVWNPDGTPFKEAYVPNGSKGTIVCELYEHPVQGGKTAHALRFNSIKLIEIAKQDEAEKGYDQ